MTAILPETKLYSEAIQLTGYGKYNLFILLAAGGCLMCVIVETMCMSFIIPAAQCDLDLSLTQKGILVSISFFGVIATSLFWGFMADLRGRRNILIFCLILSFLSTMVCSIAPWAWLFILLRFLNGALIGGASSIIYPFAGEFHDDHYRPKVISWICAFVAAGQMYIPGMAWAVLPHEWSYPIEALGISFRPWRLLMIIYAIPSLIVAALVSILPESPKFLLAKGKHDHTLRILTTMFVINTGKKAHEFSVSTIVLGEENTENRKTNVFKFLWSQTALLFNRKYVFKTILICYLQFGVFLSASALSLWFPDILNILNRYAQLVPDTKLCDPVQSGATETYLNKYSNVLHARNMWKAADNVSTMDSTVCDDSVDTGVFLTVLLIGAAIGVCYIIIGILINTIGKKTILIGFSAFTAICGLVAQYISGYQIILILCGVFLLEASLVGVVNAIAIDLYPTHVRAMALSISLMFGRAGALVGSNTVGVLFYNNCQYMFIFFAVNHVLLILAAILLPTKKTKTISSDGLDDRQINEIVQ